MFVRSVDPCDARDYTRVLRSRAMPKTRASLESEAVRLLRGIRALGEDEKERRSILLRDLAETLVTLREHFLTDDGRPDMGGKTWAYRSMVRDLYAEANVPPAEVPSLQAAVRYHIGNVLRERLSEEELEDLGLSKASPRERVREAHNQRSAVLSALKGGGGDPDVLRAITAALVILDKIPVERVAALRGNDKRQARAALRAIAEKATSLRQ